MARLTALHHGAKGFYSPIFQTRTSVTQPIATKNARNIIQESRPLERTKKQTKILQFFCWKISRKHAHAKMRDHRGWSSIGFLSGLYFFAKPKSMRYKIWDFLLPPIRKLSGLISRWMKSLECKYSILSATTEESAISFWLSPWRYLLGSFRYNNMFVPGVVGFPMLKVGGAIFAMWTLTFQIVQGWLGTYGLFLDAIRCQPEKQNRVSHKWVPTRNLVSRKSSKPGIFRDD